MEPARTTDRLAEAVARIVGANGLSTERLDRVSYGRDMWPRDQLLVQSGALPEGPNLVAWPRTPDEVAALVDLANRRGVTIVPFGGGSGVCGAARAAESSMVIDVKRLKSIRSIDRDTLTADVEAGINGEWLERRLNQEGFTLGHFPSSIYCSTLGGFIAARSAGQLSTRYGKIEDMLAGLDVVLSDGTQVTLPDWDATGGANLSQMFCGSEGTFGIFTGARMRIHPIAEQRRLAAYEFSDIDTGLAAIQEILQSGLRPAVVRLYDEFDTILALQGGGEDSFTSLLSPKKLASELLGLFPGLSKRALSLILSQPRALNMLADVIGGRCLLVLMHEGPAGLTDAEAREADRICLDVGGGSLGEAPAEHWLERRYAVSYKQSKVFGSGAFNDTAEVAGTWDVLGNLYQSVKRAIARHAFVMAHFSHAYHEGCSIYFTFVGNANGLAASQELYDKIWNDLLTATLEAGGTISHHHGVGRSKAHFLPDELGPGGMKLLKEAKEALDPQAILNMGSLGLHRWTDATEEKHKNKSRTSAFEQELSGLLGSENLREGRLARSFLGQKAEDGGEPLVVSPGAASEVTELMQLVHEYRVPLVVAGSTGLGTQTSELPEGYYVVLDTSRLDRVLDVDDDSLTVTAQAGISWAALERTCNAQGYTLGFPGGAFVEGVSVGGVLATGLPPMCSPQYGSAADAVVNLGLVTPDGTRVRTKLTPRSATGPDLESLAMGGRGVLALITGATLRVYEKPPVRHTHRYPFDSCSAALGAMWTALSRDIAPSIARVWSEDGQAYLGVVAEGRAAPARLLRDRIRDICPNEPEEVETLPTFSEELPPTKDDATLVMASYPVLARIAEADPQACFPVLGARRGYALCGLDAQGCEREGAEVLFANGAPAPLSGDVADVMRRLKAQLDPHNLLNSSHLS